MVRYIEDYIHTRKALDVLVSWRNETTVKRCQTYLRSKILANAVKHSKSTMKYFQIYLYIVKCNIILSHKIKHCETQQTTNCENISIFGGQRSFTLTSHQLKYIY